VGSTAAPLPLLNHYAGSAWTLASSPAVRGGSGLEGVTCPAPGDCWAVGGQGGNSQPLIETSGGAGWAVVGSPTLAGERSSGQLQNVACTASADCWAIGYSDDGVLIETDAAG
jgi:hypothetical protein